jgi:xanthine dehydrogenase molybdopterin-binding subunit B
MRISSFVLSLCAATLLISGCAKNQQEAKKTVDSIEESIKDIRADAERYAPDGLKSIETQIARFKADIEAKNYDDVVAGSASLNKAVDSLKAAVATGKEHARQALAVAKTEWESLSVEVPKMVETLDARVAELDKRKVFRGIKKEDFEAAKGELQTLKTTWQEAEDDAKAGKPVAAADKGKTAKSIGDSLYEKLDVKKT